MVLALMAIRFWFKVDYSSIKSDEVKIVLCAQTSLPSDASAFHFGVKYQLTYHINLVLMAIRFWFKVDYYFVLR
jgi:hypothetical protein